MSVTNFKAIHPIDLYFSLDQGGGQQSTQWVDRKTPDYSQAFENMTNKQIRLAEEQFNISITDY